jgi:hypothetical protein
MKVAATISPMLGVSITPAKVQDRDGGYAGAGTRAAAKHAGKVELQIVKRSHAAKGFVVLPKRWIVERAFGWLGPALPPKNSSILD